MKMMKHIQMWLLITLLALFANGAVSAKLASGHQNLSGDLYQSQTVLNALLHQGLEQVSTTDVSGSPLATKGGGTETVQRWMSQAELKATKETGLIRGGRDGTHFVTDSANSNAKRARQRSALPQTPEVKVTLEVPAGKFSSPSRVEPAFNMPGGGMERTATGKIKATVKKVK